MILFWMFYRKVSSKYHRSIIEHGNKSIKVTATQHPHWSLRANPLNPKSRANPLISQITIIGKDNKNVTKWASSVPMLGKHLAPHGQASCPFLCLFDLFFRKACCLIIMANPQVGRQPFRYADYDTCNFPKCDVLLRQGWFLAKDKTHVAPIFK